MNDEGGEFKSQTCVDCGATSPPIHTNYTLIGAHAWRTVRIERNGVLMPMWRCPACFAKFKRKK